MTTNKELLNQGKLFAAALSRDPAGALAGMAKKPTELGNLAKGVLDQHKQGKPWDEAINYVVSVKGR